MDERDIKMAQTALAFLQRTKMEGSEVPTFVEVNNWLNGFIHKKPEPIKE